MLRRDLKRKQRDVSAGKILAVYRASSARKKRRFTPGVDRTGGYYGRYAGPDGERKFHDVDLNDAVIAAGSTITSTINIIPQGVTERQRIGRKCTIRSINWRGYWSMPTRDAVSVPPAGDIVRIILYQDKQCNGAVITAGNLVESIAVNTFRDLANSGRFNVLMDKTEAFTYTGLASDGAGLVSAPPQIRKFSFYKECNIPLEFDSTTGALTEIRSNNLGVMIIGLNGVAGFASSIRLRFSDGSR